MTKTPQVKFIPAKNIIPWDRSNRNLPVGTFLDKWIGLNYFDCADGDISSLFEQVEPQTPKGNGFDFQIVVNVSEDPLWKDLDWESINYVASTLKIQKDQKGYSYFHVVNQTPRYYDDGHIVVQYDLELDEWCTFYENVAEGFKGKFQQVQGHKHEWKPITDEKGNITGYIPDFDNNQGISTCDDVCEQFNDKSVIGELQTLDSPNEDYIALFFTSARADWTYSYNQTSKWEDYVYGSGNLGFSYMGWMKSETYFGNKITLPKDILTADTDKYITGVLDTQFSIPYYVVFIKKEKATYSLITSIIDMFGVIPNRDENKDGLWGKLSDNRLLGLKSYGDKGAWNVLGHYLEDNGYTIAPPIRQFMFDVKDNEYQTGKKISPLSFGGNLKIEQVAEISLPSTFANGTSPNDLEWMRDAITQLVLLPQKAGIDDFGFPPDHIKGVNSFSTSIYSVKDSFMGYIPNFVLKKVIFPVENVVIEPVFEWGSSLNDEGAFIANNWNGDYGDGNVGKGWITPTLISNDKLNIGNSPYIVGNGYKIDDYEKELKAKVYNRDEIVNNKLTPHLLTYNHYEENIIAVNQQVKKLDAKDYYFNANNNFEVSIKGKPLINVDKLGWKYYIQPSWMKKDVNSFNKQYIIDTIDTNIIPYSDSQYNDFMRNNINSLQTGRENAIASYTTAQQNAERTYNVEQKQQKSNGAIGIFKGIGNVLGGIGGVVGGAMFGNPGAITSGVGGIMNGIGNTAQSGANMAIGLQRAKAQKENAIASARTNEENSLRNINARIDDASQSTSNQANINSGDTFSKFLDLVESGKDFGINSIALYTATIPDNQKDIVWYMRNVYGDGFVKTWNVKSLDELLTRHYFTTLKLTGTDPMFNKMNIPTIVKDTLKTTFENVVSLWDIGHLDKDSMMNYNINNYDNILDDPNQRLYRFSFKLDQGKLVDTSGKEKVRNGED